MDGSFLALLLLPTMFEAHSAAGCRWVDKSFAGQAWSECEPSQTCIGSRTLSLEIKMLSRQQRFVQIPPGTELRPN